MGIKTYNPYTPSRRQMTGSDFSEITTSTPEKSLVVSLKKNAGRNNQVKSLLDTAEAEAEENTESSTSREEKMESMLLLRQSNTIQTEQQTSL